MYRRTILVWRAGRSVDLLFNFDDEWWQFGLGLVLQQNLVNAPANDSILQSIGLEL